MINFLRKVAFIPIFFILNLDCYAITTEQLHKTFLQAEQAINNKNDVEFLELSSTLVDYPLYFYLRYQWLLKHLSETQKVQQFLEENESPLYAGQLREKWLEYLYKNKRWVLYVENHTSIKSKQLECRYQWAKYQSSEKKKVLQATKNIWLTGHSLPEDCDELLAKFKQSEFLTQKLIWNRFKLAIYRNEETLAGFVQRRIEGDIAQADARKWRLLLKNINLISEPKFLKNISRIERADMLVYAIQQMVIKNLGVAMKVWDDQKKSQGLSELQISKVERSIAMYLVFSKSKKAYQYFRGLKQTDKVIRAWEVRAALITGNWVLVQNALNKMPEEEISMARWQYWQARTYLQTNQFTKALEIFGHLSKERSYYGFLAADYVLKGYALYHQPIVVDDKEVNKLLKTKGFAVINEFRGLQRIAEAKQYWDEVTSQYEKLDLLVAAKIADNWKWHKQAILAVARVKEWNDINLRFPINFEEI